MSCLRNAVRSSVWLRFGGVVRPILLESYVRYASLLCARTLAPQIQPRKQRPDGRTVDTAALFGLTAERRAPVRTAALFGSKRCRDHSGARVRDAALQLHERGGQANIHSAPAVCGTS